ncbi:hypothetical protein [Nafulsella turpanensis]|uniref:hypothetical protein n=1 Tax=Nafulsella turpanensis TaxID=1265690 RepID=UPI0003609269|nr:hypothetical protein [Nafulsella turpanensis]
MHELKDRNTSNVLFAEESSHTTNVRHLLPTDQQLLNLVDGFFDIGKASGTIETLHFLLNSWIESDEFKEYQKSTVENTVFEINNLVLFIVRLQEQRTKLQANK